MAALQEVPLICPCRSQHVADCITLFRRLRKALGWLKMRLLFFQLNLLPQ
jgi:hypothetical protein